MSCLRVRVVFFDNVYVAGSSTPLSRTDAYGNTYQLRRLDNGSTHEVLKNFPTEPELRDTVAGLADEVHAEFLRYYWILSYTPKRDARSDRDPRRAINACSR